MKKDFHWKKAIFTILSQKNLSLKYKNIKNLIKNDLINKYKTDNLKEEKNRRNRFNQRMTIRKK